MKFIRREQCCLSDWGETDLGFIRHAFQIEELGICTTILSTVCRKNWVYLYNHSFNYLLSKRRNSNLEMRVEYKLWSSTRRPLPLPERLLRDEQSDRGRPVWLWMKAQISSILKWICSMRTMRSAHLSSTFFSRSAKVWLRIVMLGTDTDWDIRVVNQE